MRTKLSVVTIRAFEKGGETRESNRNLILLSLESAGVQFIPENGGGPGVRLRKHREDRKNLDDHISHLETKVADLKPEASGKPSPAKGMAMLRRGRAKSDLAKAKNKREKGDK